MTLYAYTNEGQYLNETLFFTKSWSTIITKLSPWSIKVKRYYEPTLTHSILIKFTGTYNTMPDELKDKNNGDNFTDNNYNTPHNTRFGTAGWYHDNEQLFTEGEFVKGVQQGKGNMYRRNGEVIEGEKWCEEKKIKELWAWNLRKIKKNEKS